MVKCLSGWFMTLIWTVILALSAGTARGTSIQDLVRIKGHESNVLTGMGIVIGLPGTGDTSKDSYIAARPYARLLTNLGNPVDNLEDLSRADAFALVAVTMRIPPTGVREGDRLDVSVEKLFNAKSLEGGRLIVSLLRTPGPDDPNAPVMAFAEGSLVIEGDNPCSAVVRKGGQMLRDIRTNPVARDGSITIVLNDEYAGYPVAIVLAEIINEELGPELLTEGAHSRAIARVEDAKNVRIQIPDAERAEPAQFIAMVMTRTIDPSFIHTQSPARIVINEKEGIISVTGNVQIGPVGITHKGMQFTTIAAPPPAAEDGGAPTYGGTSGGVWTSLDTTDRTSRASTGLIDLLRALDRLKVPVEDQIAIIFQLKKTGSLHAEIVHE